MAFWCMFFIRFLMLDFGMFSFVRFSMECSYSCRDGYEGFGFPTAILDGVIYRVVFGVFV